LLPNWCPDPSRPSIAENHFSDRGANSWDERPRARVICNNREADRRDVRAGRGQFPRGKLEDGDSCRLGGLSGCRNGQFGIAGSST
jgi:hypothetical protein